MKRIALWIGLALLVGSCVSSVKRHTANETGSIVDVYGSPTDYAELYADASFPEIARMGRDIQIYIRDGIDLTERQKFVDPVALESEIKATRKGVHCSNLWKVTCSKEVGHDRTGYAFTSPNVDLKDYLPGLEDSLKPKFREVVNFLYEQDPNYSERLTHLLPHFRGDPESAKDCMAETMARRAYSEGIGLPSCFRSQNPIPIREFMGFDSLDSLYVENRARRAVRKTFANSSVMKNIEKVIVPNVLTLIKERVFKHVRDGELATKIANHLDDITFGIADCPGLGTNNAWYRPDTNTIAICYGHVLQNRSLFATVSVIAHELTHSIDPCVYPKFFKPYTAQDLATVVSEYPFGPTLLCLAQESSVGARMLSTTPDICKSQFGESFADTMAAEILTEYMARFASDTVKTVEDYRAGVENIWRTQCRSGHAANRAEQNDVHPRPEDRTNFILGANRNVRRSMGCATDTDECRLRGH